MLITKCVTRTKLEKTNPVLNARNFRYLADQAVWYYHIFEMGFGDKNIGVSRLFKGITVANLDFWVDYSRETAWSATYLKFLAFNTGFVLLILFWYFLEWEKTHNSKGFPN